MLVARYKLQNAGQVDWTTVANLLGTGRSPWVVFRKYMQHLHWRTLLSRELVIALIA
jgi:hypothetical protein